MFNVIDVALALFNAVKAIPDAISHLDPSKITDALPELAQKVGKLAPLVPQLSVPLMIVGLVDTLLAFLGGLAGQLRALIDQQVRIQKAENRAAELGNAQLQAIADCSKHHVATQLQSLSESVAPVNRLIALVNVFAQLAGLGPLPDLLSLGSDHGRLAISTELAAANSHSVASARPFGSRGISASLCSPRCSRIAPLSKIERSPSVSHGTWPNGWCARCSGPRSLNDTLSTRYGSFASSNAQRTRMSRTNPRGDGGTQS